MHLPDHYYVFPDGSYVQVEEYNDVADAWRGDDFSLRRAVDFEEDGTPIFEGTS